MFASSEGIAAVRQIDGWMVDGGYDPIRTRRRIKISDPVADRLCVLHFPDDLNMMYQEILLFSPFTTPSANHIGSSRPDNGIAK